MNNSLVKSVLTALAAAVIICCSLFLNNSGARAQSAPQAGNASTPITLSYQGVLKSTGTEGNLSAGTRLLTVTLYADANGNTTLWQSTMNTPIDSNGVFNLMLGSEDNPLPAPSAMDRPIWLGVAIDNGPELRPLAEVTASAYAINVADNAITSTKLADHSVTASKMATDYVSSISVNGQKVTGQASNLNIIGGDGVNLAYDDASKSLVLNTSGSATNTDGKGANAENASTEWQLVGNTLSTHEQLGSLSGSTPNSWFEIVQGQQVEEFTFNPSWAGMGHSTPDICGGWKNNQINETATSDVEGGNFIGGGGGGLMAEPNTINYCRFATIGGGLANQINAAFAGDSQNVLKFQVIGGGEKNQAARKWSSVLGGERNSAYGEYSTIGGGNGNIVDAPTELSTIAGGDTNLIFDWSSSIGGGDSNSINSGNESAIAGGSLNSISNGNGAIGGGRYNLIYGAYGTIAGGDTNTINVGESHSNYDAIGGGLKNNITESDSATIAGGAHNNVSSARSSFIGGGTHNTIFNSSWSVIGGGDTNYIGALSLNTDHSVIGGGYLNLIKARTSAIGGGESNAVSDNAHHSAMAGGQDNLIDVYADHSFIGGGEYNYIAASYCVIGGGGGSTFGGPPLSPVATMMPSRAMSMRPLYMTYDYQNEALSPLTTIGGGYGNVVSDTLASILGGGYNLAQGYASAIGGGAWNQNYSDFSAIGGGYSNAIDNFSANSTLAGGVSNYVGATAGTVGGGANNAVEDSNATVAGGFYNVVQPGGPYSAIPGGDSLTTQSFAQTVVGYNNLPAGGFAQGTKNDYTDNPAHADDPLFIIGNGNDGAHQSNGFTVSYDGHATVTDNNGSGGASLAIPPGRFDIYGSTYQDNQIVAWAQVPGNTAWGSTPITIIGDFGVETVTNSRKGEYDFVLFNTNSSFTMGSVVATLVANVTGHIGIGNRFLTTTVPTGSLFSVFVTDGTGAAQNDVQFTVQVVGR